MTTPLMNVILPLPVTWELDGLVFNDRDGHGCEWIVDKESGWTGAAGVRTNRSPKVNTHGSFRGSVYRDVRVVSLSGYCAAPSPAAREDAEQRIAGICADPDTLYPLRCNHASGTLVADVELDDEITVNTIHERWFTWSLQVCALDPRKYSAQWQHMTTGLASDAGDGLDFSQVVAPDSNPGLYFGVEDPTSGLVFGTSNATGFMTLSNSGTAPTFPIYTISGPLTSPTLTTGNGSLKYNRTLNDGETLEIDPSVPSVLFGGEVTHRRYLAPAQFQEFAVPPRTGDQPGTLSIGLIHEGAVTSTGQVSVTFRDAYF